MSTHARPIELERLPSDLCGARVRLRPPCAADEAQFVALRAASRAFLAPWEATLDGHDAFGPERFQRFLVRADDRRRFVLMRRDSGRLAGALSLSRIEWRSRTARVGFWIGAEHARQGLMSEALELVARWSAAALGLERLEAFVLPENAPSRSLLAKHGFVFERLSPAHCVVAGRLRDHELWTRALDAAHLPQSRK